MDEYGCCNLDDAQDITRLLWEDGCVVFSFSLGDEKPYVMCLSMTFHVHGKMAFGGNPSGMVLCGLLHHQTFWFDPLKRVHSYYVAENLGLGECDAENVTKMLDAIFNYRGEVKL